MTPQELKDFQLWKLELDPDDGPFRYETRPAWRIVVHGLVSMLMLWALGVVIIVVPLVTVGTLLWMWLR